MEKTTTKPFMLRGVKMVLRNFEGAEKKYNQAGPRNFKILLDDEFAERLLADRWNVKYFKLREDADPEDTPQAFLEVKVSFDRGKPPSIWLLTDGGNRRTRLDENTVPLLDTADLANVDIMINPFEWDVNGNQGVKAYLKNMYATLNEDELDELYRDVPSVSPHDVDV